MTTTIELTLLGTAGGPGGHLHRAGIASLVTVGGRRILVDAGVAVVQQLAHAGCAVGDVDTVLLTHLHDDHTAGLPALMTFRHTMRGRPLTVIGPPGTAALRDGILAYLRTNTAIRGREGSLPDPATLLAAREVEPGVVMADAAVTVTAVENTHYALTSFDGAHRSYALRFDSGGRSIVFTGDTGESPAVTRLAAGADILVSEMVTEADAAAVPAPVRAHMRAEHLSPTQVGRMAAAARVRTVVLSHYTDAGPDDLAAIAREFSGEIIAGEDLMRL
ncbi:MBL fold metallo-hydrolase [Microbacterium elymi]|uniref:MBL fold metallo-hydrolase n=1 Tax=Microbacterium elymi TaxID=2909587 RepID=A0ABY5NLV0_9MICO|nr:MBL fold metallo-hydrolase [Microbacterium elymi]UUT36169.1 MBL fold metallo-hydrolase [Microbacterium elymi]